MTLSGSALETYQNVADSEIVKWFQQSKSDRLEEWMLDGTTTINEARARGVPKPKSRRKRQQKADADVPRNI